MNFWGPVFVSNIAKGSCASGSAGVCVRLGGGRGGGALLSGHPEGLGRVPPPREPWMRGGGDPKSCVRGSAVGYWGCAPPTAPARCGFSPVSEFARWANVPGAATPAKSALPAPAVSDVTLGMGSEKNCPWFLSVPTEKRRLGSSGGTRRSVPAEKQPGPLVPARSLPALCQPCQAPAGLCRNITPHSPAAAS